MAIPFMNLPRPGDGVSSLMDFAPLAGALQTYNQGSDMARKRANMTAIGQTTADKGLGAGANQALQMGELDAGLEMKTRASADDDKFKKRMAAMSQAVDLESDPARKGVMWNRVLKALGDTSKLSPEEMDPMTGPKLLMAEAGIVNDPLERQTSQARLNLIRAQTNAANKSTQKAPETRDFVDETGQKYAAQWNGSTWERIGNSEAKSTPAQTAVDKAFAKTYEEDFASGGVTDQVKNLSQLSAVRDRLKTGNENLTGPILGRMPDAVTSFINPSAIDTRDRVE